MIAKACNVFLIYKDLKYEIEVWNWSLCVGALTDSFS